MLIGLSITLGFCIIWLIYLHVLIHRLRRDWRNNKENLNKKTDAIHEMEKDTLNIHNKVLCETQGHIFPNRLDGNNTPSKCSRCGIMIQ